MYKDPYPEKRKVNFLFNNGGLGDCIARLPAINYVIKNHQEIIPQVWLPDFMYEFARRSLPELPKDRYRVYKFSDNDQYNDKFPGRPSDSNIYTNLSSHMTHHAFCLLVNKNEVPSHERNYLPVRVDDIDLSRFNLPEKYVVVCTGFTAPVREFIPEWANPVIDYIRAKGYAVVFLGREDTHNGFKHSIRGNFDQGIEYDKGINLINQTSLLESTKIIYGAKTIVGIDNGLLHVANTHPTLPIVGGFTNVDPATRMGYREGILGHNYYPVVGSPDKRCYCQTEKIFAFAHPTFTECYYGSGKKGKCLNSLSADLFLEQLSKIL